MSESLKYYSDREFINEYGTEEQKQKAKELMFSSDSGTRLRALVIDVASSGFIEDKVIVNIPPTTFEKITVFPMSIDLEKYISELKELKTSQIH